MSLRQERKQKRTGKDKWGFSLSISRRVRRALRRQAIVATIDGKTYNLGEKVQRPMTGGKLNSFLMNAGGSSQHY